MSLASLAIRAASVRAIRAAIWAGFDVVDSPQRPLDLLESGRPLIAVYTGRYEDRLEGSNALLGEDPRLTLLVQIFLPVQLAIKFGDRTIPFDTREQGADTLLDVIDRRIRSAFVVQAEPWSELLFGDEGLVTQTTRIEGSSYLVEKGDVRTSARELMLDLEVVCDPVPGAPPADAWARLIEMMRADTEEGARNLAPVADWLASEIQGPAALTQDERDRIDLGLSAYAAQGLSILPIVRGSEVPVAEIDVEGEDDTLVVEAET